MFWILLIVGAVLAVVGWFKSRALMYAGVILLILALVVLILANVDTKEVDTSLGVLLR